MAKKKIMCSFSSDEAKLKVSTSLYSYKDGEFIAKLAGRESFQLSKAQIELRMSKGDSDDLWSPEEYLIAGVAILMADEPSYVIPSLFVSENKNDKT